MNEIIIYSGYRDLYQHIIDAIENKTSLMIWGDPGAGKTSIVKYISELIDYHLEVVMLSSKNQYSLNGIAVNKDDSEGIDENYVGHSMPDFIYNSRLALKKNGKNTVFLFDEINTADRFVLTLAYQFLQEHKAGNYEFNENDIVIATANYENTGGITESFPLPLANRVKHVYFKPTVDEWIQFYARDNIHPLLLSFFSKPENHKHFMNYNYEELAGETCKSFASPRSISALSKDLGLYFDKDNRRKHLEAAEKLNDYLLGITGDKKDDNPSISVSFLRQLIQSHVGTRLTAALSVWIQEGQYVVEPETFFNDHFNNKGDSEDAIINGVKNSADYFYVFTEMIGTYLRRLHLNKDISKEVSYYCNFLKDKFEKHQYIYGTSVILLKKHKIPLTGIDDEMINEIYNGFLDIAEF